MDRCTDVEHRAGCGDEVQWTELLPSDVEPGDSWGSSLAAGGDLIVVLRRTSASLDVFVEGPGGFAHEHVIFAGVAPTSVATDGHWIVVADPELGAHGGVWVLEQQVGTWNALPVPIAAGIDEQILGDVAVHGDSIAVLAFSYPPLAVAVVALTLSEDGWDQQLLAPVDLPGEIEDPALALGADTIALGIPSAERVYLFERSEEGWAEQPSLTPTRPHWFGHDVAIAGDRMLVGASGATPGPGSRGAAHLYQRTDATWERTNSVAVAEGFGRFVDARGDRGIVVWFPIVWIFDIAAWTSIGVDDPSLPDHRVWEVAVTKTGVAAMGRQTPLYVADLTGG